MARQLKPRTHAGNTWTKARYFSFLRSVLRRGTTKYPVKFQVKEAARRPKDKAKPGRHRFEYECVDCNDWFPDKEVILDHIIPCGSLNDFDDLPGFVERLFCEPDNLQVMCVPCHHVKTKAENIARKKK